MYQSKNLSVLAYANGFTLWHYANVSGDNVLSKHYFSDASDMLREGDLILSHPDIVWVTNNADGHVMVSKK